MALGTKNKLRFLAVVGPTASGKSDAALRLARELDGEIVCCDSVQLYRGFDIGSAKPSTADRALTPHHLFDVLNWNDSCDAAVYADMANAAIDSVQKKGKVAIVTGGTGLYLRALCGHMWHADLPKDEQLRSSLTVRESQDLYSDLQARDPRRAAELHPNDRFRVIRALEIVLLTGAPVRTPEPEEKPRNFEVVFLEPPRGLLAQRIKARTASMLILGLVEEVKNLLASGVLIDAKPMQSIGYFEVAQHLLGKLPACDLAATIETATRQYAKRQCNWFRKVEREYHLTSVQGLESVLTEIKLKFLA